jgi:type I restriction enzyme, R subunit
MFLTGFDSPLTNTLYVDKNLRYHSLIQAYSRTNRIRGEKKAFGNIVCFRNLKEATDEAIKLYSDANASTTVLMKSYEEYTDIFNKNLSALKTIAPDLQTVDDYQTEEEKAKFVTQFRILLQVLNRLTVFTEFTWEDLNFTEQEFENYKSKYLDIYQSTKEEKEKVSILDDIDFDIELLKKDIINATYIIMLLKDLDRESKSYETDREFILSTIDSSPELRSKKELIEAFIEKNLSAVEDENSVEDELYNHFEREKHKAFKSFIAKENLNNDILHNIIEDYEYSGKIDEGKIKESFNEQLKFIERKRKASSIKEKIIELIEKFTFIK